MGGSPNRRGRSLIGGSRSCRERRLVGLRPADVGDNERTDRAGCRATLREPPARAANRAPREPSGFRHHRRLFLQHLVDDSAALASPLRTSGFDAGNREAEPALGTAHSLGAGDEAGVHSRRWLNIGQRSVLRHDAEEDGPFLAWAAGAGLRAVDCRVAGGCRFGRGTPRRLRFRRDRHSSWRTARVA